jgi:translation initiation factor IF-2
VQEVPEGSECGIAFDDWQDMEEGDVIECFVPEGRLQADEEDPYN